MKKLFIFLSIIILTTFNYVIAKDENTNNKKTPQEETTDKFFKNIVDNIEKTTEDSVNKIAKDLKDMKEDSK